MENTRSTTFSIRLKPAVKKRLAKLAKASGRSSNFLISDAVESYVVDQERLLAEIRQADRQVRAGHYIKHEDMKAWLLSWGTDHELPPPKCVCGKEHHDEGLCQYSRLYSPQVTWPKIRMRQLPNPQALPDLPVARTLFAGSAT